MKISPDHITDNARKILDFLQERRETISPLLILTHDYPDPDTLASAFALAHLCEKSYGITCRIAYGGVIGRTENRGMVNILRIPVSKIKPGDFKKYEHFALLDTQPPFANNPFPKHKRATIIIDQHPSAEKPLADLTVIDPDCGATSAILAQCLLLSKIEIPQKIATALAYGILSDTLNLYRADRQEIIETYFSILSYCDLRDLAQIQHPCHSRKFFATLGKGIGNAIVRRDLVASHLGVVENPDLVSQCADFLLTYKDMRWAVCTGRYKGKLHVSFRTSNQNAEAGEILRDVFARREDAGGHHAIAGGSLKVGEGQPEEKWKEAEDEMLRRLMKRLRISAKGEFYFPFRA